MILPTPRCFPGILCVEGRAQRGGVKLLAPCMPQLLLHLLGAYHAEGMRPFLPTADKLHVPAAMAVQDSGLADS